MKHLYVVCCFLITTIATMSQNSAVEGNIDYQRKNHRAAIIEVPYSPEVVEDAIKEHMTKKGAPGTAVKGFRLYRNVRLTDGLNGDMYVNVERKSRREKEVSVISVIVGRPNETITNRIGDDSYGIIEAKQYLNNLIADIEAHNLQVEIGKQEELLEKAQRKFNGFQSDSTDLVKRKAELEDKMTKNAASLQSQRADVEKQKEALESLKARRKP